MGHHDGESLWRNAMPHLRLTILTTTIRLLFDDISRAICAIKLCGNVWDCGKTGLGTRCTPAAPTFNAWPHSAGARLTRCRRVSAFSRLWPEDQIQHIGGAVRRAALAAGRRRRSMGRAGALAPFAIFYNENRVNKGGRA